jgi:DNA topoisomerase-1
VCRKSYIHPEIVACYLDGSLLGLLQGRVEQVLREDLAGLRSEEAAVLALLQQRLSREADRQSTDRPRTGRKLKDALRRSVQEGETLAGAGA